tara:strand:- start:7524 stop:8762 length:1239 start_codon:yes stop_codon:yes gene_type:complete
MLYNKRLQKKQNKILKDFLRYSSNLRKKKIFNSPFLYPCTWYQNLSKVYLHRFLKEKNTTQIVISYIKEILLISSLLTYKIYKPSLKKKIYKDVVITWSKNKDIKKGIISFDRFTKIKANKNCIFFSVNLEKKFEFQKLNNTFFLTKTSFFSFNTLVNLMILIKFMIIILVNKNIFYSLNVYSFYAYLFHYYFEQSLKNINFKNIIMSYEGQPFQNFIIKKLKKKNISVIGIVNSFQPFPLHLYKNDDAPDKIKYGHKLIKNHMIKKLKWKNKDFIGKVNIDIENFKGKILLPFSIRNYDKIYETLYQLLKNKKIKGLNKLKIKVHPNTPELEEQLNLKYKLKRNLISNISTNEEKIIIAIGATSVIVSNLILGNTVYQIYENETLECLSTSFWPNIISEKIDNNVVKYRLR